VVSAGGPETSKLVSAEVRRALGPKGFLINVSRGSVIDENALIEALEQGVIAGAGLDVYADEPRVPEKLLGMEQVMLLPHLASATHETRQAMADLVLKNLDVFYSTGRVHVGMQ
jgi:hydroxypyruvate reductase